MVRTLAGWAFLGAWYFALMAWLAYLGWPEWAAVIATMTAAFSVESLSARIRRNHGIHRREAPGRPEGVRGPGRDRGAGGAARPGSCLCAGCSSGLKPGHVTPLGLGGGQFAFPAGMVRAMSQPSNWPACGCQTCAQARLYMQARPSPPYTQWGLGPPSYSYAQGGLVPQPPPRPAFTPGIPGFGDAEFTAGALTAYRWWTIREPPLSRYPGTSSWDPGLLRGARDSWGPGLNEARCLAGPGVHDADLLPHFECGCGFWAYWEIQNHDLGQAGRMPVLGVIRGSGRVLTGPRGFRSQKARITGLYPALTLGIRSRSRKMYRHPQFTGTVISIGTDQIPAPFQRLPEPAAEDVAEAEDRAEAWMGEISIRLEDMYPGAEVFASLDLMKAKFPEKSEYVPPARTCPYCRQPDDGRATHILECPGNT